MRAHDLAAFAALVFFVFTSCGCRGEKGAKVTGVLLNDGQPLQLADRERVELMLVPTIKDETSLKANPGAEHKSDDGSFVFIGPGQGLVAPGEYKVCVKVRTREGGDRLGDQFSEANTPLAYTVGPEPKQAIVIDIGAKSVTRK